MNHIESNAQFTRGADDLHAILREVALLPFLADRPDATAIADRVAGGEDLTVRIDLGDGTYTIVQGNLCLQAGVLAKNESTHEIADATGILLVAALNREPEERRKEIALRMDDMHLIVALSVGAGAEAVVIQLGQPPIFTATRISEVAPELHLVPNHLH